MWLSGIEPAHVFIKNNKGADQDCVDAQAVLCLWHKEVFSPCGSYAISEGSGKPVHPQGLARALTVRPHNIVN